MHLGIQAVGSEGDLRPFIALAGGLRRAGHEVTIALHGSTQFDYGPICQELDLRYIAPSHHVALKTEKLNALDERNWALELAGQFWRDGGHEDVVYDTATALCTDNDAVIGHYLCYPTKAATIATETPYVAVQLTHELTPTMYRPPFPEMPNLGEHLNPVMWNLMARGLDIFTLAAPVWDFWRRKRIPPFRHLIDAQFSELLNILAVSSVLCESQPDWDGLHVVTGSLEFNTEDEAWTAPKELQEFLDSGTPPVFMCFGSTQEIYPGSNVEDNLILLLEAAGLAGCRAVIQTPPQLVDRYPPKTHAKKNRNVFFIGRVPYGPMFSKSAAIVHHGGAGTCHLAARSGRPSVAVPFTTHHWFLAYEMYRVGMSPKPVFRHMLTPPALAGMIRQVLNTDDFRKRAEEAGKVIWGEDGVGKAVDVIQHFLNGEKQPALSDTSRLM